MWTSREYRQDRQVQLPRQANGLRIVRLDATLTDQLRRQAAVALNGDGGCSLRTMTTSCFASESCATGQGAMKLDAIAAEPHAFVAITDLEPDGATPVAAPPAFVGCVSAGLVSKSGTIARLFPSVAQRPGAEADLVLSNLCVADAYRKDGVGRRLIDAVLSLGAPRTYLLISRAGEGSADEDVAETFAARVSRLRETYRKLGFAPPPEFPDGCECAQAVLLCRVEPSYGAIAPEDPMSLSTPITQPKFRTPNALMRSVHEMDDDDLAAALSGYPKFAAYMCACFFIESEHLLAIFGATDTRKVMLHLILHNGGENTVGECYNRVRARLDAAKQLPLYERFAELRRTSYVLMQAYELLHHIHTEGGIVIGRGTRQLDMLLRDFGGPMFAELGRQGFLRVVGDDWGGNEFLATINDINDFNFVTYRAATTAPEADETFIYYCTEAAKVDCSRSIRLCVITTDVTKSAGVKISLINRLDDIAFQVHIPIGIVEDRARRILKPALPLWDRGGVID
jgi:GNAT superfamily N-acetyltransferase